MRLQPTAAEVIVEVAEERRRRCEVDLEEAVRLGEVLLVIEGVPGAVGLLLAVEDLPSIAEAARTGFVAERKDFVAVESCTDSELLVVAEA